MRSLLTLSSSLLKRLEETEAKLALVEGPQRTKLEHARSEVAAERTKNEALRTTAKVVKEATLKRETEAASELRAVTAERDTYVSSYLSCARNFNSVSNSLVSSASRLKLPTLHFHSSRRLSKTIAFVASFRARSQRSLAFPHFKVNSNKVTRVLLRESVDVKPLIPRFGR